MKMEDATAYTAKCFNGEPASCSYACPFHLDIRSFLEKAGKGRWMPAYKELRNAVVFPVLVSVLCDEPCRDRCQRTVTGDEPIALRDIEKAVIRYAKNRKPESYFIPPKTQSVAVVGAGAAGLSCALNLAQKKYKVTVFDRLDGWGGSLRNHPQFKEFDEDFALQFSAVDVTFKFGTEIKVLDELESFDAVYIATGAGGESFGLLESWDPELLTTSNPKVFMGGALCGAALMESIAQGLELSKTIEVFLMTGKTSGTHGTYGKNDCGHYLTHDGEASVPLVTASSEDGYTEEEAKAEAQRCFKCDCDYCEKSCEMLKWFKKKPHRIAVEVATDSQATSTLSARTITRETYSCNICGKCKSVCPENVDIGALLQFSRTDRLSAGKDIPAYHDYWLREMEFNSTEGFFAAAPKGEKACSYAFFPGCQLGALNKNHTIKSFEYLSKRYRAGLILGCCGAPAYWAGDEKRMSENTGRLREAWENMGKPVLVFACAYCERVFRQFMPEIKGVSLYELLAADKSVIPVRAFCEAAVFDPCAAGENEAMQKSVRLLAERAGTRLEELREPFRCCGYGGHMQLANPELYDEITAHRTQASDKPYIAYCANCREVFDSRDKQCVHILDMVFTPEAKKREPGLQQKRRNSLEVKKTLMKECFDMEFEPKAHEWDGLKLVISSELLEDLDKKLILEEDLKEAIWLAEKAGDMFISESDGIMQCSMEKSALTYWVQYKKLAPDTFEIIQAFSHRMHIKKED
jgi:Fe-S oxidoreductase